MNDEMMLLLKAYNSLIQQLNEFAVVALKGMSPSEVITIMQSAYLEQLKLCFEAMMEKIPEGERISFAQYLRNLASAHEALSG